MFDVDVTANKNMLNASSNESLPKAVPLRAVPDDGVLLPLDDLGVVGEQHGVIGLAAFAGGQDSPRPRRHRLQTAVVDQQVIHQQLLHTQTNRCTKTINGALPKYVFMPIHFCFEFVLIFFCRLNEFSTLFNFIF